MTDLKDCRYCSRCGMQVEGFDTDPIAAEKKAADWWNRGIYDAGGR